MSFRGYHALHKKCRRSAYGFVDNVGKEYTDVTIKYGAAKSHAFFGEITTGSASCILEFALAMKVCAQALKLKMTPTESFGKRAEKNGAEFPFGNIIAPLIKNVFRETG